MLFFSYCKEEPVQPKEATGTAEISAAKKASEAQLALQLDKDKVVKNERLEKLKLEIGKTFAVRENPKTILARKLNDRKSYTNNSSSKNYNGKTVMANNCYEVQIDIWLLEKYHKVSGYELVINPKSSENYPQNKYWQYDQGILGELKNKYAFSKVVLEEMAMVENANRTFNENEIIIGFKDLFSIPIFINAHEGNKFIGCYIDEPMDFSPVFPLTRTMLHNIKTQWQQKYGTSKKITFGERTQQLADEIDDIGDYINSSIYQNYQYYMPYSLYPFAYYFSSDDQRPVWTDFKNSFGTKFNSVWINGQSDQSFMQTLIGHSKNLGINNIWLYENTNSVSDEIYWEGVFDFCHAAWINGFLQREERRFTLIYTYIGLGDPCTDTNEENWMLIDFVMSNQTIIL